MKTLTGENITGLELLSRIHGQVGYLILTSPVRRSIGEILNNAMFESELGEKAPIEQPVRVIAEASDADFWEQVRLMESIAGKSRSFIDPDGHGFHYKVVAAD